MKKIGILITILTFATFLVTANSTAYAAKPGSPTIVDIVLAEDGEFDVLQEAVIKANLVDALSGNKQVTVFAPTDQAFIDTLGAIDESDAITIINSLDEETLQDILLFHVTNGRRISDSVLGAPQYKMLNGQFLTQEYLLDAGIAETDIKAANGIVHVIDSVLLP